jgi:hypothetical protein
VLFIAGELVVLQNSLRDKYAASSRQVNMELHGGP